MAKCLDPFIKKGETIPLPCGKCFNCQKSKVSAWSFRLSKEAERCTSAFFVTLTYNTSFVPLSPHGFMTLCKQDLQNFFKRLRKTQETKLKYYACGEYGTKSNRPHYHIILFNCELKNLVSPKEVVAVESGLIELNGQTPMTCPKWPQGQITIGQLTDASAAYTLKYINKGRWRPKHQNDDRQREFPLMSKKLGDNYLTPQMVKWHKEDPNNRLHVPLKGGKKAVMPRYYRDKIYNKEELSTIIRYFQDEELREFSTMSEKEKFAKYKKDENLRTALGKKMVDKRDTSI